METIKYKIRNFVDINYQKYFETVRRFADAKS